MAFWLLIPMRTPLIVANWKENKTNQEVADFVYALRLSVSGGREVVLCPSYVSLITAYDCAKGSAIKIGCQDISGFEAGAYTGEVSPIMIKGFCTYAIIGHSERRKNFHETDESVNLKVRNALKHGIQPIICVGEKLQERKEHRTEQVVRQQLTKALSGVTAEQLSSVAIAYEPVWAISGGDASHEPATPETAEKTHQFIRKTLEQLYNKQVADFIRIIYGGSVKPENMAGFMKEDDIDGALVGNASLPVESFLKIINY